MKRLQQTDPIFKMLMDAVPPQPYASDYPIEGGLYRTSKRNALQCDLIQLNGSNRCSIIILDIDYDITLAERLLDLPLPNIVMTNPKNRHCHIGYVLASPVPLYDWTPQNQRLLLRIVQDGLTALWEADSGYSHLISKNPFSDRWLTYVMRQEPYTLGELRGYVDDDMASEIAFPRPSVEKEKARAEFRELGRNCALFEDLRHWAYREIHNYFRRPEAFFQAVLAKGMELNTGDLPEAEVRQIAKSISRWTYENMTPQRDKENKMAWSKRATEHASRARSQKRENRLEDFERLYVPGETYISDICKVMGISEKTGKRYAKEIQARKQAEQPDLPGMEGN